MLSIWKYPIPVQDSFSVDMPEGATVLSVNVQRGTPCMWVLVDPERVMAPKQFLLRGTGHSANFGSCSVRFCGTFLVREDSLVFHLFQILD
jgi:hypothetical protein